MRLHGRLWRRIAIGTLLLLSCLPATLAPDTPPIDPARILEQLDEASSELVPNLSPSHSFPSGTLAIPHEGSSSSAINSALGGTKRSSKYSRPPSAIRSLGGTYYRIEMQDEALVKGLMDAIQGRANDMTVQPSEKDIQDIEFVSARRLLGPSGQPEGRLAKQISSVLSSSTRKEYKAQAPLVDRYNVGNVEYFMQGSNAVRSGRFSCFNVLAIVGRGTAAVDRIYLGVLKLPEGLVKPSKEREQDALAAAQRAAVEPVRVDPANIGPGGVGQALQHNEAGLDVEHVRPFVHPNKRPRLGLDGTHFRIGTQDETLVHGLMEAVRERAKGIPLKPGQRKLQKAFLDRIQFQPARELLEPSGEVGMELQQQISSAVTKSKKKVYHDIPPIVDKYYFGHVEFFLQPSMAPQQGKLHIHDDHIYDVVATIGRGTDSEDRIFLGRLLLPSWWVKLSKPRKQKQPEALPAARRAAAERIRVESAANIGPGSVQPALQHNEAGLDVEQVRQHVRPNQRPRLDLNERPPFDLNELPHENESGEDA